MKPLIKSFVITILTLAVCFTISLSIIHVGAWIYQRWAAITEVGATVIVAGIGVVSLLGLWYIVWDKMERSERR